MENYSDKKIIILECAIDLFKEFDYDKVTIKQICEKASIPKSTFHYYYKAKEDLIKDFFKITDINASHMMQAIYTSDNSLEQMWKVIELYYKRLIDAGVSISKTVYISNIMEDKHILGVDNAIAKDMYITFIKRGREKHLINNTCEDDEKLLSALVYALTGIAYLWCVQNGNFDLLKECRSVFETVLNYNGSVNND